MDDVEMTIVMMSYIVCLLFQKKGGMTSVSIILLRKAVMTIIIWIEIGIKEIPGSNMRLDQDERLDYSLVCLIRVLEKTYIQQ